MNTFSPAMPYPRAMRRFPSLRQSWLSAFDNCALETRFDFEYRKGWSTSYQARGQMFHRFAGRALQEMARHGEEGIEVDVAMAILHEVLRQEDIDRQCPECFSTNIRPGMTRNGLRTCDDCRRKFETELVNLPMSEVKDLYWVVRKWAKDNLWDTQFLHSTEQRFRAVCHYGHFNTVARELTGKTDAVFIVGDHLEHAIVLDWKDMWAMPPESEVSKKGFFQQRFYAWLLMRQPEFRTVDTVTLREFYVRYSEPREATLTRDRLDDIEHELGALAERFDRAYEENVWPATPGSHCGFCMLPSKCPIPVMVRGEGRITSQTVAERVAKSLLVAEEVREDNTRALKAWSDLNGPVPAGKSAKKNQVMGYQRKETVMRPTKEAVEQAVAAARRGDPVHMDRLYRKRVGTRFGVFVPGPEEDPSVQDALLMERLEASVAEAQKRRAS